MSELDEGARIAGYLIKEKIGQGGMAVVFRAYDERLDRTVALKLLEPSLAADDAFRQRFIRESRAAAAVDDPHIIPVFEAGEANNVLFIAMRFVPGGDVLTLADDDGRLPVPRAVEITAQAASALDAAHARGLVHRDVKPANMLVDPGDDAGERQDHVYLSDFGLSKWSLQNTGLTDTGMFLGTVDFSAPEQIEGKQVDGRADQYSLACAAFQLLTGAAPFHRPEALAALYGHVSEPPPALTDKRPDLPMAADAVFARALAKAPSERYPTCREFAGALRGALGLGPGGTTGAGHERPAGLHPATQLVVKPPTGGSGPGTQAATPRQPQLIPGLPPTGYQQPMYQQPQYQLPGQQPGYPPPLAGYLQQPVGYQQQPPPQRRSRAGGAVLIGVSVLLAAGLVAGAIYLTHPKHTTAASGSTGSTGGKSTTTGGPTPSSKPSTGSTSGGSTDSGSTGSTGSSGSTGSTGVSGSAGGNPFAGQDGFTRVNALRVDLSSSGVSSVTWNAAGTMFATSDKDDSTFVWNRATGKQAGPALPGSSAAYAAAISPDGSEVAIGYENGTISLRSAETGKLLKAVDDPDNPSPTSKEVDSIAFNSTGTMLISGDGNGLANLWSVSDGGHSVRYLHALRDPDNSGVWSAVFSSTGMVATGDYSGDVYLWNLATRQPTLLFSLPADDNCGTNTCAAASALAFSQDGELLAAGNNSGSAELWSVTNGTGSTVSVPGDGYPIWAASFSSSGLLAFADNDGSTYLYRVSEATIGTAPAGLLPDPNTGHQGVGSLAFSPNGTYLVTGDTNGEAYVWHVG